MSQKILMYLAWFAAILAMIALFFWFFDFSGGSAEMVLVPSRIVTSSTLTLSSSSSSGSNEHSILNQPGHYRVSVPLSWYVEENGGTRIALYPDYNPSSTVQGMGQPSCKIEISVLQNSEQRALGAWLSAYLHQDPTQDAVVFSEKIIRISGRDGIVWTGALHGVSSTLVYALGDAVVYEIAPSAIGGNDCVDPLQKIIPSFTILAP